MDDLTDLARVYRYHDGTKHHFDRYAPSLGYLDWASQPRPFRSFHGSPVINLFEVDEGLAPPPVTYDSLFDPPAFPPLAVTAATLGHFLRHSLGLSAWKVYKGSRWSLRVNPSSGNLHPTEAYVVAGPLTALGEGAGVWHYAPDRHAIEQRCAFDPAAWRAGSAADVCLVALTSIHWRESWKYGERAFRYCQHDLGHAVAALSLSARLCGWRVTMLPRWPHRAIASITGIDRDEDYVEAEREEPACMLLVARHPGLTFDGVDEALVEGARQGRWFGRASQLSEDHIRWTLIDEVARATEDPGRPASSAWQPDDSIVAATPDQREGLAASTAAGRGGRPLDAAALLLQRRSAVALTAGKSLDRETFLRMLTRTQPSAAPPWHAIWWRPRIHLVLFVHRVDGVTPGLYMLARSAAAVPRLRAAFDRNFQWSAVIEGLPLWLLQAGDYRARSKRLSCDQDIAADGFFSLGMIADFDASLGEQGPSFYRHLFWEAGAIGQVLYLEAEAAGARATGIGCFFDDPVHQLLGIDGHVFQSLYHFTVGMPLDDSRLTTEPGYPASEHLV